MHSVVKFECEERMSVELLPLTLRFQMICKGSGSIKVYVTLMQLSDNARNKVNYSFTTSLRASKMSLERGNCQREKIDKQAIFNVQLCADASKENI